MGIISVYIGWGLGDFVKRHKKSLTEILEIPNEDRVQMIDGYAATNFSIIHSFVINLFRRNSFNSITKSIRHCAQNILRTYATGIFFL
ncbi:MAG: hypothetical protein AAFX80_09525 [Cyanobacteria bacterium J06639_18]